MPGAPGRDGEHPARAATTFGILGPVEVVDRANTRPLPIGGRRQIALLAFLLLNANRAVAVDELIDALWRDHPVDGAAKRVQVAVARLRRSLAPVDPVATPRIETVGGGYRLVVRDGELDATVFETVAERGRRALAAGDVEAARQLLAEALELWRGPPLADVAYESFALADVERLTEARLSALEARIEADMRLGRHGDVIGELEALVERHRHREALIAQLMRALYRAGRQADALAAYRRTQAQLADELGLEPNPDLVALQAKILAHDPSLRPPVATAVASGLTARAGINTLLDHGIVGREEDLAAVSRLLLEDGARLLTLTGPGGVGKTRLAIEAARRLDGAFADGAHIVELGAVQRAADVPSTLLQGLEVVPVPGESAPETLRRFLGARDLLLVADNFEHVLGAAPEVSGLLAACPSLRVLATSREWLSVRGERRYAVAPLAVPDAEAPLDAVRGTAAVALFVERARDQDPAFALDAANASDVIEICGRVDGLPLALELAAARIALMTPAEIAARLNAMLAVLGAGPRDAPARHRTLRATIDWSHALLSDEEQQCFARFAVFVGDADIAAVETVTGASLDTLSALVAKSLLVRRDMPGTAARLRMLETVRAYALERFSAAADRDSVRARHARWYLDLAREHGGARTLRGPSRAAHLVALDADIENIHAALRRALEQPEPADALAGTAALAMYWGPRARTDEAFEYMDAALALPSERADPAALVEILVAKANYARFEARGDDVEGLLVRAEAIARASGDPRALCWALITRAEDAARDGRLDDAASFGAEATRVATAAGDEWALAHASYPPAVTARTIEELRECVARAEPLLERHGSAHDVARLLTSTAYAALYLDAYEDALVLAARAVALVEGLGDGFMTMLASGNLGLAALLTGDIPLAGSAFRRELALCRELGQRFAAGEALLGAAAVAAAEGRQARSARLVGAIGAHRYGIHQEDLEETFERMYFAGARARLGAEQWDVRERDGAAMTFEEAIAYALEEGASGRD